MSEEQAVKSGQFSDTHTARQSYNYVSSFEPDLLKELKRNGRLYIVADSVWGGGGNIARQYAIRKVLYDFYRKAIETDLEKRLVEIIQATNTAIFERNQQHPSRRPMATTLLAALIHDNKLFVVKVGDGQALVVWEQSIEHLGQENPASPETSENLKSKIQNLPGLGLATEVPIELFSRRLFVGDTVVLCSGGLTGYISDKEIIQYVNQYPPQETAQWLVELARGRGCLDNGAVSVTQILAQSVSQSPPTRASLPEAPDWETLLALPPQPKHTPVDENTVSPPKLWQRKWFWGVAAFLVVLLCVGSLGIAWGVQNLLPSQLSPFNKTTAQPVVYMTETSTATGKKDGTPTALTATHTAVAKTVSPTSTLGTSTPPESGVEKRETLTPTATLAPPTATPTPRPTVILPPGCTNGARFYSDLTVEDGTTFIPNEKFDKVWLLENKGTCPWAPGYSIRFVGGDTMQEKQEFSVPMVEASTTQPITVPLVAPSKVGTYRSEWQMHDLAGQPFGANLSVQIEVVPPKPGQVVSNPSETTLYDFVANAAQAKWSSKEVVYGVLSAPINADLVITAPLGIVVAGSAELRGGQVSEKAVLLTHPHQQLGFTDGVYQINIPLQPTDRLIAVLGFPKVASLNSDGVTFEIIFTPASGRERVLLSKLVKYRESPVSETLPLTGVEAGQTGTFTLRVLGGENLDYDWALWIDLRLVR